MIRALCLMALLLLGGCSWGAVLIGLQVGGAVIGVADKVLDVDVSLRQDKPGKAAVVPVVPELLP